MEPPQVHPNFISSSSSLLFWLFSPSFLSTLFSSCLILLLSSSYFLFFLIFPFHPRFDDRSSSGGTLTLSPLFLSSSSSSSPPHLFFSWLPFGLIKRGSLLWLCFLCSWFPCRYVVCRNLFALPQFIKDESKKKSYPEVMSPLECIAAAGSQLGGSC